MGDLGSIPGSGRSPQEENGNPLQYSCLENPHGWRSLAGCNQWGCKETDMTERPSTHSTIQKDMMRCQFPSMVTSCKTIVKYDNQDIHTDNQDTGRFQHYVHSSSCPFKATPTAYLTPFLSTWQQPVCSLFPQCLSFQDCYINKIINQMNFLGVEFLHSHISHVHPGGFMYQYLVPF